MSLYHLWLSVVAQASLRRPCCIDISIGQHYDGHGIALELHEEKQHCMRIGASSTDGAYQQTVRSSLGSSVTEENHTLAAAERNIILYRAIKLAIISGLPCTIGIKLAHDLGHFIANDHVNDLNIYHP